MTTGVELLESLDDFLACEHLQRRLLDEQAGASILGVPTLRAVAESGGVVLGIREGGLSRELVGVLVDLATTWEGFPALFSVVFGVSPEARNRGLGLALRQAERRSALAQDIEVIRTWVDPLRSVECHLLWNRLGAIGTRYERNLFGELPDRLHRGLATDRVHVEWWLRSPRALALLEQGVSAMQLHAGLHEMAAATRTSVGSAGHRVLVEVRSETDAANVLAEVPVDLDRLRDDDPAEARKWRLGTRELFERLLSTGYLLGGLVHEGGRSFQLFVRRDRSRVLGEGEARVRSVS